MVTEFRKQVGQRIRKARINRKWRQEDLAESIGKTPAYVGMLERGERSASLDTFIEIAAALDVTADELLCDVVVSSYRTKLIQFDERIKKLNHQERQKLFDIIEAYLSD